MSEYIKFFYLGKPIKSEGPTIRVGHQVDAEEEFLDKRYRYFGKSLCVATQTFFKMFSNLEWEDQNCLIERLENQCIRRSDHFETGEGVAKLYIELISGLFQIELAFSEDDVVALLYITKQLPYVLEEFKANDERRRVEIEKVMVIVNNNYENIGLIGLRSNRSVSEMIEDWLRVGIEAQIKERSKND
jgi:hypothetical protein